MSKSNALNEWGRAAAAKTEAGAVFFWDGEMWPDVRWEFSERCVRAISGNTTLHFDAIDDLDDIKRRARFMVDAK